MAGIAQRVSNLLINKLDLAFTLGRIFGLLPVLIMSRLISDTGLLADRIADYQVAMFLATLVLYGGPQVYLVKHGIERRVFVYHMAISSVLFAAALGLIAVFGWASGLVMPFLFLVVFRSYYLLFASYLKTDTGTTSYVLVGIALITLAVFGLTLSYALATLVCFALTAALSVRLGYGRGIYARVAGRQYFGILHRNAGFFAIFLLQQTYTQITLAVYAIFASGTDYLLATHLVYIYSLSFVLHGVLFRYYLSKMSRSDAGADIRATLKRSIVLSLLLGVVACVIGLLFYVQIENLLFGRSLLTFPIALMLAAMILLNSSNFGWSALFMSAKEPFQLAAIALVSTVVVIGGIVLAAVYDVTNGLIYAMLLGLLIQAALRTLLGLRLLRSLTASK